MRLKVGHQNEALYFRRTESTIVVSEEIEPGVILGCDAKEDVVGIEILGSSKRVPVEMLKSLRFQTA
jgi:uncharacterized protein YuzE